MRGFAGRLRRVRPGALLLLLCLLLYTPGIAAIPPLDRDEARFAQATRQMLETGDFLRIRFQDEARNRKPAGIYWLQAAAVGALSTPASTAIWPYRLPSLVGGIAAALLTCACAAALFRDEERRGSLGLIAAVLLASALGVVAEAHIAKTDAALLAAITTAQSALGLIYTRARAGRPVSAWLATMFWSGEIAAIYLKGPVGPALGIVTVAALSIADRDAKWLRGLRPVAGITAVIVAVAPWLVAIEHATEGGFLAESLGRDLLAKLAGVQESHGAPPLSYLVLTLLTFWPGSLLLVPAMARAWRRRDMPAERFLLAWLVPGWLLLELMPTKLPHYALPLYPALAMLAAAALVAGARRPDATWARRLDVVVRALWAAVTIGLAALLVVLPWRYGGTEAAGVIGAVLLLALGAAALHYRPDPSRAAALLALLALAFAVPAGASVLPGLDRLWLSRAVAELVAQHPPPEDRPLVAVGYSEPSLVFLLGTRLRLAPVDSAADMLRNGGEALVGNRDDASFRRETRARSLAAQPVGSVSGIDYSNGQHMTLTLYAVAPG